jgi:hypothetical protein
MCTRTSLAGSTHTTELQCEGVHPEIELLGQLLNLSLDATAVDDVYPSADVAERVMMVTVAWYVIMPM